jgi:D-tyrosyl-tRNA(Tyr) deacylase
VQRVREAAVNVGTGTVGAIGPGLLVLCSVTAADGDADRDWLARKIAACASSTTCRRHEPLIADVGGELLAVSQFTLYASTRKGARPSYSARHRRMSRPRSTAFVLALERARRPVRVYSGPTWRFRWSTTAR